MRISEEAKEMIYRRAKEMIYPIYLGRNVRSELPKIKSLLTPETPK